MAAGNDQGGALRNGAKAPDAFRTIREVADDLGVPQHVLRFWETKFSQIKPLKRGGGRRYYRPEDIELLRQIRSLLYEEGYTIRGVQKLLRETSGRIAPSGNGPPAKEAAAPAPMPAPDPAPAERSLDAKERAKLERLKAELETLRDMLRGRV